MDIVLTVGGQGIGDAVWVVFSLPIPLPHTPSRDSYAVHSLYSCTWWSVPVPTVPRALQSCPEGSLSWAFCSQGFTTHLGLGLDSSTGPSGEEEST